jgi:glycosyltransferase involved in cell wall biosynthesis
MMRISRRTRSNVTMLALITATKNSIRTIRGALESAASFRHKIKHYLIDAASSDGTREYLASFVTTTGNSVLLSQTGTGLYPALNQAVVAALADPVVKHIGFLHSDDRFISTQFNEYLSHIDSNRCDFFYSDIEYHDKHDRRFRVWNAGRFSMFKLNTGWMPPHTSVVVAKRIYRDFGVYDPSFGTAADYEWIVRVLSSKTVSVSYYQQRTLSMLVGGASGATLAARLRANAMDGKAWAARSVARSSVIRLSKPLRKALQFRAFPQANKATTIGNT